MLLYLVRHGIAIDREEPNCPPEAERHLTPQGVKKTRQAARGLRALGVRPQVLFTSPYLRAVQTAEIVCRELGCSPTRLRHTRTLLPDAAPSALPRELARVRAEEVMCFGHAPNLDLVVAHILGASQPVTEMKKSAVVCLQLESRARARGILVWAAPAKLLRRLEE